VAEERISFNDFVSSIARFSWSTVLFGISMVEMMSNVLTTQTFAPRGVMKTSLDMAHALAEAPQRFMPGGSRLAWQELQNKLEVFSLFEHLDLTLRLPPAGHLTLRQLMARASTLGPYRSVWATEGIGHYYAECMRSDKRKRSILQSERDGSWPTERLAALHAGMGLSLASEVLETKPSQKSSAELRNGIQKFLSLCRDNSHEGYLDASYEALGLVARNLYPHLLPSIDAHLAELDQRLIGYFWHGVGRAIYFAPSNFLPTNSAPWRAVEVALSEPPHELGRCNALAGVIWSLALVNLRQPQLLELFLKYHPQIAETVIFDKSLGAALLIWRDSSPNDTLIEKLGSHQPSTPALANLWKRVSRACSGASESQYLVLKEKNGLGSLFRCC
jgi:hypothetical protein